jgi:lipopolysaccharide transport system permease protein
LGAAAIGAVKRGHDNMIKYKASLSALLLCVVSHRELVRRLAGREFSMRFRGSALGFAWTVITPLILAIMYTFVFDSIFKMRWGGATDIGTSNFAIYLLVGLAVHGVFVECLSRAPGLIIANPSYVTKVVFPLEVLPFVVLISALTNAMISLMIAALVNLALSGQLHPTVLFIPILVLPYALFVAAVTMVVAAVGVYLRDLSQLVSLIIPISLFLSPVFYPIEAVPRAMQPLISMNPLTFAIEQARLTLIRGDVPNLIGIAIYTAASMSALAIAYWSFQRLRGGFADVI